MGWPRPGSSAYPVLSLQCLLTAALNTRLAPDCSRAGQGRGHPVLCGQLWSWLFPLGVLKQMLHALHLQPAPACLDLWALEEGPQGHLCSLSPSGRWRQCQALEAHLCHCPDSAGEPQASETQRWTPVGDLGPRALVATFLHMDPPGWSSRSSPPPTGTTPLRAPPWLHSRQVPSARVPRFLRTRVARAPKAQNHDCAKRPPER